MFFRTEVIVLFPGLTPDLCIVEHKLSFVLNCLVCELMKLISNTGKLISIIIITFEVIFYTFTFVALTLALICPTSLIICPAFEAYPVCTAAPGHSL